MQRDTWKRVHAELTRLARSKGVYDAEEARWLLEGKRVRVHEPLGYGTFLSYLEHVFGYGPRLASERLRVAEALTQLPAMTMALTEGELCWSAVRELTRVAVPATEAEWIAAAQGKSMREVEDIVSGRSSGDRPGDPADPALKREVLRLEVTGDGLAAFREARRRIELDVGHSLDDDAFVRMLAHHVLGGPTDAGRAAYQVAMTVCPQCRRGTRDGAGRELAVEPHVVEAALCDAQHIGDTHVDGVPVKASQTIPPRIRRLVVRRAHGRCEAPGCRAAKYLEIHHIVPRADGGTHDPSQLILLCSADHMAIHRGALQVSGTAPDRLEFRRRGATWSAPSVPARGAAPRLTLDAAATTTRTPAAAHAADACDPRADAIDALRRLGFAAADARRAVETASSAAGDLDALLREALSHLRPPVQVSRASEPRARYGSQARHMASTTRPSERPCPATKAPRIVRATRSVTQPIPTRVRPPGVALTAVPGAPPDQTGCGMRPRVRRSHSSRTATLLLSQRSCACALSWSTHSTAVCSSESSRSISVQLTAKACSGSSTSSRGQCRLCSPNPAAGIRPVARSRYSGADIGIPASSSASRLAASTGLSSSSPPPAMPCQEPSSARRKIANSSRPSRRRNGSTRI